MNRKEEILVAMGKLFLEVGYDASMTNLAKNTGLSKSSIYSHYESKDQIIYKIVEKEMLNFYNLYENKIDEIKNKSCEYGLKEIFYFLTEYYKEKQNAYLWAQVGHIPNEELKKKCVELKKVRDVKLSQQVSELLNLGARNNEIEKDNLDGVLQLYLSAIFGNTSMLRLDKEGFGIFENNKTSLWDAFWDGIKIKQKV